MKELNHKLMYYLMILKSVKLHSNIGILVIIPNTKMLYGHIPTFDNFVLIKLNTRLKDKLVSHRHGRGR